MTTLSYVQPAADTSAAPAGETAEIASAVPPIVGPLKTAVTAVGVAVGALGLLGFVNSFHRVDATAQPSFHGLAWTVPTGIDLGIFVFSALDIVLAILNMRIVWLRLIPWALTAVTIQLNIANRPGQAPLSAFDKLAHGVLPTMWTLSVEVGAHVVRKRARLTSDKRMDRVRVSRWLLAPLPTLGLWRRMVLWEERSYPAALARERTRVLAKTDMQDRYGRMLRFTAPRRERALYRLGELTPSKTDGGTAVYHPDHLDAWATTRTTGALLTTGQAARYANTTTDAITRAADTGELPTTRTKGGHRRIRAHDLTAWMQPHSNIHQS